MFKTWIDRQRLDPDHRTKFWNSSSFVVVGFYLNILSNMTVRMFLTNMYQKTIYLECSIYKPAFSLLQ